MRTKLFYVFVFLGLHSALGWAQQTPPDQGDPIKELRAALSGLASSRIPSGVLLNRMLLMTDPHLFAGQGDTSANYQGFAQQYWEFFHAALDTSQLPATSTCTRQDVVLWCRSTWAGGSRWACPATPTKPT